MEFVFFLLNVNNLCTESNRKKHWFKYYKAS